MRNTVYIFFFICIVLQSLVTPPRVLFDHHTYKDFRKGQFSDAGVNLYVSRQGHLQFINLFDLNFDGYPEVALNNDHNIIEAPDVFVYNNTSAQGLRSLSPPFPEDAPQYQNLSWTLESLSFITRLQAEGGGKSVVADLNGDGYKDLVFVNFIHGSTLTPMPAYIYWGDANGFNPAHRSILNGDRSSGVAVDDVTGDGLPDIVLANAGREHLSLETPKFSAADLNQIGGPREKTSYLFVQTEAGFVADQRIELNTSFAIDVKIADLDHDGKKEIIFLELGAPGSLRILEQKNGKWTTRQLLPVIAPKPLATGKRIYEELLIKDLNKDGYEDIFAPSSGMQSEIFWNQKGTFSQSQRTILETENAMSAAAADLNGDGYPDLTIANYYTTDKAGKPSFEANSYVWWGSKDGFERKHRTALPTLGAVSVTLADIDNNGSTDILFAQHRNQLTLDVPNYIYLNIDKSFSPEARMDLQGFGTVNLATADLDGNGKPEVIVINSISGKAYHSGYDDAPGNEGVGATAQPMYIYRGNAQMRYGPANLVRVPQSSAETNYSFADVDDDGKADLIHLRGTGSRITIRYDVYNYPSAKDITEINVPFRANSVNVADFNKDGILDLIATPITGPQILLCMGEGKHKYKTQLLDFPHFAYCANLADINRDGLLDLVTCSHREICISTGTIQDNKFSFNKPEIVQTDMLTTRVSMADFNNDGWPDIVAQNLQNTDTKHYDVQSWVLINKEGKFSLDNKRNFTTYGANGGTIAQLWNNGQMGFVASNYHADASRKVGVFVFKPDADGFPEDSSMQRFPAWSSGANMVLDFNGDGFQDILVCNHTGNDTYNGGLNPTGGTHGVGSFIYWGSKEGYELKNRSWVSSFGPHSRIAADPGSLSRRNAYEVYTSELVSNSTGEETFLMKIEGRFNKKQFVDAELFADDNGHQKFNPEFIERSDSSVSYKVKIPKGTKFRYRLRMNSSNTGSGPLISRVMMKSFE